MTRVYYRDAKGCIIMLDLTNRQSFLNVTRWKEDLDSKVWLPDGSPIPCLLLANKVKETEYSRSEYFYFSIENLSFFGFSSLQCDLKDRQVDLEEIEKLYNKMNFIGWTETSAKVITQCNLDRHVTDTGLYSLYNATKARICLRLRRMVE